MNTAIAEVPVLSPVSPVLSPVSPVLSPPPPAEAPAVDTGIARIRKCAWIVDTAHVSTRQYIDDYFSQYPNGDISKFIIEQAANNNLWLTARRGSPKQKLAMLGTIAGPGSKTAGMDKVIEDCDILAPYADSGEKHEKYAEIKRIALFCKAVSKMISVSKKATPTTPAEQLARDEKAVKDRAAKREENKNLEQQVLEAEKENELIRAKLIKFIKYVNEITDPSCKLSKAAILQSLLEIACE